jgi:WD40 repeat protein
MSNLLVPSSTPVFRLHFDVFGILCQHLKIHEIGTCAKVCKYFEKWLTSNELWKSLFSLSFPNEDHVGIENFRTAYQNEYLYRLHLPDGTCSVSKLSNTRSSFLAVGDNAKVFSASRLNDRITVCDLESHECTSFPSYDNEKISSLLLFKDKLVSGSKAGWVRVWDPQSGQSLSNYRAHDSEVSSLAAKEKLLFSASLDQTIKIWDSTSFEHLGTLSTTSRIYSILVTEEKLFAGGNDAIWIWNGEDNSYQLIKKIDHSVEEEGVYSLAVANEKFYAASETIKSYDLESFKCKNTFKGNRATTGSILVAKNALFSISSHKPVIVVWDAESEELIANLEIGTGGCSSLALVGKKLLYGSSKGIWQVDLIPTNRVILVEIASQLESNDNKIIAKAIRRFLKIPPSTRDQIYPNAHPDFAKTISCSIRKYLRLPLDCIGIMTEQQYSDQISCDDPNLLQKVGILCPEDLELLCSVSKIQTLAMDLQTTDVELENLETHLQSCANRRKSDLSDLCQRVSKAISAKMQESNNSSILIYDRNDNPWTRFEEKLNAFRTKFDAIVSECDGQPEGVVKAFTSEKYNELASEWNTLAQEFNQLDCNHQMAKLRMYLSQSYISNWGRGKLLISDIWDRLHAQRIFRLTDLPQEDRDLAQILQMGMII